MPLAAVASILIVLIAWLIYGDWGMAWNVGACFVPLLKVSGPGCPLKVLRGGGLGML
jgi:hypothetical protein